MQFKKRLGYELSPCMTVHIIQGEVCMYGPVGKVSLLRKEDKALRLDKTHLYLNGHVLNLQSHSLMCSMIQHFLLPFAKISESNVTVSEVEY